MKEKIKNIWNNFKQQLKSFPKKALKTIRWYAAFALRLIGFFSFEIPKLLLYALSDLVKNPEDNFKHF